ncbi:ATP-binding cassette domain-containing protein [Nocardiopsis coralliicola]
MDNSTIRITGARKHNLTGFDLAVPRRAITVFTGVSGSGKTSLVFDTIAAAAQRGLNSTFTAFVRNRLPSRGRPDADLIENLSPVVLVDQRRLGGNARSTVGTITDVNPLLRLLFSRAGTPRIGESGRFSFNAPEGMCGRCEGLGRVVVPDVDAFLDLDRSLEGGAIRLPGFGAGRYWYGKYADIGLFDPAAPLRSWTPEQREALLYGGATAARLGTRPPKDYIGLVERFTRIYLATGDEVSERKQSVVDRFTTATGCPDCGGARLSAAARSVRLDGRTIMDCTAMEVGALAGLVRTVRSPGTEPVVAELAERLDALDRIGLGYLTLDRATTTLSGGESQRIKTVRHLGSSLTEMLYVFDEPSIGLHPHDIERLRDLLRRLRDRGNTVLVVEHDPGVIAAADHVVELGPGAGAGGGRVVYQGTAEGLASSDTATGRAMRARPAGRGAPRAPSGVLTVADARRHNLRGITVELPRAALSAVTGVAGSGKSSLVAELLEQHPEAVCFDQKPIAAGRRSSVATFSGIADPLRRLFAAENAVSASLFSANSAGACPVCSGAGVVFTDLAFMEGVTSVCEACGGRRFTAEVLRHTVDGRSIADVWETPVSAARELFADGRIRRPLDALDAAGVGHLTLGRPLSTLSGGECQRVKLAAELARSPSAGLYVLDEPTTGLHRSDVARLLGVLDRLVDAGATVVVVEHDLDVVRHADWVVDLGPGAGSRGGRLLHCGPLRDLFGNPESLTAAHLRRSAPAATPG